MTGGWGRSLWDCLRTPFDLTHTGGGGDTALEAAAAAMAGLAHWLAD